MSYRRDFERDLGEARWTAGKLIWTAFVIFVMIAVLGWVFGILSRPAAIVNKITDPDKIIADYEWFQGSYNDCLALDQKIATTQAQIDNQFKDLPKDRNSWSRQDREEYSRLNALVTGLRSQRGSVIAEYNARSKLITRNLWKQRSLPYKLVVINDQTKEDVNE